MHLKMQSFLRRKYAKVSLSSFVSRWLSMSRVSVYGDYNNFTDNDYSHHDADDGDNDHDNYYQA